jgi:hypothetical protein
MRFSRQVLAALCSLLAPSFALAYNHPLGDDTVREAYFIGQDKTNVNSFLAQYTLALPLPPTGPHVAEVELSTPYAQVVEDSAQNMAGYSAQQAAEAYRKRGDAIVVRLKILFTPTFSGDDDYWRTVSVSLIQKRKLMSATAVNGEPIYTADPNGGEIAIGVYVYVTFSVVGVEDGPLQVEIEPPGGPSVRAKFDLSSVQ